MSTIAEAAEAAGFTVEATDNEEKKSAKYWPITLAFDPYHEMIENGLIPSEDAMQAVLGACAKEGKCDIALSVFQNMMKHGFKSNTISCNALTTSLGNFGKVKLAFKVYNLLESLGHTPYAHTFNALVGALDQANQHSGALHLVGHHWPQKYVITGLRNSANALYIRLHHHH